MDTSPITGFITRKQAAEQCERSERTLQRYWSRAVELHDAKVLSHLKLRTEDGETIEGINVTKDLIEDLKNKRQNPTWYAKASWVVETYKPRPEHESSAATPPAATQISPPEEGSDGSVQNEVVTLLKEQLSKRDDDIKHLREELSAKNELLREKNALEKERNELEKERHAREKETNELMKNLGGLLVNLQQGLLAQSNTAGAPPQSAEQQSPPEKPPSRQAEIVPNVEENLPEKGTPAPTKPGSPSKPKSQSPKKRRSSRTKSRSTTQAKKRAANTKSRSEKKTKREPTKRPTSKARPTMRERVSSFFRLGS